MQNQNEQPQAPEFWGGTFMSGFKMNQHVLFRPMLRHQQEFGIADTEIPGKIAAVRFTESAVFYDIYDNYWGKIFEGVDSNKVKELKPPSIV